MSGVSSYNRDTSPHPDNAHRLRLIANADQLAYLDLALDGLASGLASRGPTTPEHRVTFAMNSPTKQRANLDPPRLAKYGLEWVWYPEGYWAERPIPATRDFLRDNEAKSWRWRSTSSKGLKGSVDLDSPRPSPKGAVGLPQATPVQTPFLTEKAHVHYLQHPGKHTIQGYYAGECENVSAESLALQSTVESVAMPAAESGAKPSNEHISSSSARVDAALSRPKHWSISDAFHRVVNKGKRPAVEEPIRHSTDGPAAERVALTVHKGFGKIRFIRQALDSTAVGRNPVSVSSSRLGDPSMSALRLHWDPCYPAGEATRIDTPSIDEAKADGKLRKNLFELNRPTDHGSESASLTDLSESRSSRTKDLYGMTTTKRHYGHDGSHFDFIVSEHLPSDPICPANPKCPRRGMCPFHGSWRNFAEQKAKNEAQSSRPTSSAYNE